MTKRKAIMFVDFENFFYALKNNYHYKHLQSLHLLKITRHLREKLNCDILFSPIYADWGQLPPEFQVNCVRAGCHPVYVSCFNYVTNLPKKDVVDKNIIIDAMEWLHLRQPAFDILVLLSGDRDFMPLVERFMNQGKDVVLCPVKKTCSAEIIEAVSDTIFIDDILAEELDICKSDYEQTALKNKTTAELQEKQKELNIKLVEKRETPDSRVREADKKRQTLKKIVTAVYDLEKRLPFVGFTYFRDKVLRDLMFQELGDDYRSRQNLMLELMESGFFSISQQVNPKRPEFKTSVISVNRNNTVVWQWFPELSEVTKELEQAYAAQA